MGLVTTTIKVRTPTGRAKQTHKLLKPFILGGTKHLVETNKEDNEITWTVTTSLRRSLQITKNVSRFDYIIKGIMGNKRFKKLVKNKMGGEQIKELEDMLLHHTTIEVIS